MSLALEVVERAGWVVVIAAGRIDATTAAELEAGLVVVLAREPARLAFDFAALDYLSSPGLRVLLACLKAVNRFGGALRLVAPRDHIRKVLSASGVDRVVDVRGSLEEM